MFIPNLSLCTGCGACVNTCPSNAIRMTENHEGYLKPYIDFQKCVACGKCDDICPVLAPDYSNDELPDTYALQIPKKERMKSASGGAFYIMAKKVIKAEGAVYGAVWNDDFSVSIVRGTDLDDIELMRGSKYVQSNTERSYTDVKQDLENGLWVLYAACPCQIAGLKKCLSKKYDNLITVDILCTCAPSQKMFKKYLSENENELISHIRFRDKNKGDGRSHTHSVYYTDGACSFNDETTSSYELAFSKKMLASDACAQCKFSKLPRQGDVTIGDFWGIEHINEKYNNKDAGCSLLLINSEVGKAFLNSIDFRGCKFEKIDSRLALNSPNVIRNRANFANRRVRHAFFKMMHKYSFNDAVTIALESDKEVCIKKYDVGIVGFWSANNYGSILTNYALYEFVKTAGYSVAMIEFPDEFRDNKIDNLSRQFANKYLETTFVPIKKQLTQYNDYFDKFLVGSDQVWHPNYIRLYDMYMYLDFVQDSKTRMSYSSSVGVTEFELTEEKKELMKYYLNKFNAVSLRESDAVSLYGELGIKGEHVLDPVWLCDTDDYEYLISKSKLEINGDFIFSYILDVSVEKINAIEHIESMYDLKCINVGDLRKLTNPLYQRLNTDFFASVEDWLYYIKNAKLIITDSHHGVVFAMIYNKPFVCINNPERTSSRFTSLFNLLQINEHLVGSPAEILNENYKISRVDYDKVNSIIEAERKKSGDWLINALSIEGTNILSDFDVLLSKLRKIGDTVWDIDRRMKQYDKNLKEIYEKLSELKQ